MYYKVGQILLQSGKPFCITDRASGITKYYRYCKVELFLSQSGAGITKLGNIYLQSGTIITKLDRTCLSSYLHHIVQLNSETASPCVRVLQGQLPEMVESNSDCQPTP